MPKRLILIYLIICISPSLIFSQTLPFTFSPNTPAKAEEVNSNFQFLAKQFKRNEKTINCPNDNISKAIEDGYNSFIINGTCQFTPIVTSLHLEGFKQYGFSTISPTTHLQFEGGTNGVLEKDPSAQVDGMLVWGGRLFIKNMRISQKIYVSQSAQAMVDNSELIYIASQQSSSVDLRNVIINCSSKNCLRASGSSHIHADNITVNNSTDDSSVDIAESSFAEIKNSTFNDTSPNSNGSHTSIWVATNGGLQLEDTNININNGDVVVELGGILNLNGGQIVRSNGSPTLRVNAGGTFWEYNNGLVNDIQCENNLSLVKIDNSSGNIGSISGNCTF